MAKGMVKGAFDQNIYTRTKFTIEATKSAYNDARGIRSWSDYTEVVEMRWNRDYVTPAKTWWNSGDDNQRAYRSGVIVGTIALSFVGPKALPKAKLTACFIAGTTILLADGSSKAIENVKVGDRVASYNTESGEQETRTVARTFVHENVPTYDVTVDGATVTTTEEHPFFVVGKGWTAASDLQPGDQLQGPDGSTVTIHSVLATGNTATVYNFEVESTHDYYVQVGTHWVLVHNDCTPTPTGTWFPNRRLPIDTHGVNIPDSPYPHTQLGWRIGRRGSYPQAREFGFDGQLVRDIDFTDHRRPLNHSNPHQHPWIPNETGGSLMRGPAEDLE